MKFFFETEIQSTVFLLTVAGGFLLCMLLDVNLKSVLVQAVLDLLLLTGTGAGIVLFMMFSQDPSLRIYHLLGLMCGSILYICGIGRGRRKVEGWIRYQKAGIQIDDDENNSNINEKG